MLINERNRPVDSDYVLECALSTFPFQKLAKSNQKSQKLGKNGNLNYFPTASPKSYWELGSQVPTQFPRLFPLVMTGKILVEYTFLLTLRAPHACIP